MNSRYNNLTIDEIREEIYSDFIQEYYDLSHEELTDLVDNELTKYTK